MIFIRIFIISILMLLIAIGDAVITVAKFLLTSLKILFTPLLYIRLPQSKQMLSFPKKHSVANLPRDNYPKEKKIKSNIISSLPVISKFKYFFIGSIFSLLFVFIPLLVIVFLQDLPSPKILVLGQIPQTTKIYDRNGKLLYQMYGDQNRTMIPLSSIPKHLQEATIAIEDKDFYKHPGFDVTAIIRSAFKNLSGNDLQGGSTITQQLIKSALLTPETSLTRKLKEVVLAFAAERMYSKNQILAMYFNYVPYGGTTWGVETASQTYFGKKTSELTLAESAFLAGIPRAPSIYSPYGSTPNLWKKRQTDVLVRMRELGYITKEQEKQALEQSLSFNPPQTSLHAPHFVMYVRDLLVKKYGLPFVERGGLTVVTSIDLTLQEKVQKIVADEVANNRYLNLTNGSALVTNPKNGDILAMVGSHDFQEAGSGNVNVTTARRQPGSSIKIVTYAAALSKGYTAATILDDSPVAYRDPGSPTYAPVNYDGRFHGRVPLRLALANSYNVTAVRTLDQIGIPTFIDLGRDMGITTWKDPQSYGLSITLGSAEVTMIDMTTVYGVLANNGNRVDTNPFIKITDSKNNILEEKKDIEPKQVLDPGVAFIMSSILSDAKARSSTFGINSILNIPGKTVSVKTGTTDSKRDNWTIGYTPNTLVAVWVGNNDNSPMSPSLSSGITGAAPIWNKIMTMLLQDSPDTKPIKPENIVEKNCLGRIEYFVRGTENSVSCRPLPTPSSISPSTKPQ